MEETSCPRGDTAVEVMRDELRELASSERKLHRASALNKSRVGLGEIPGNVSFTTDFVAKMGRALKKKSLKVQEYACLQNALIQSEEHVNCFLKVDNVLFSLVRDLSGNDPALQLYIAGCCCNIALGNTKACTALGKRIAPYLIAELETLNRPLLEVCVWTIGNLVTGSQKAFDILAAQGCLKYLTALMRDCDDTILSSVTYAIMHYLHAGFHEITEDQFIEIAQVAVKRDMSYKDVNFIWLLAFISSVPTCNEFLYIILPKVVDYLYGSDVTDLLITSEVTASVRILANTICTSSEQSAMIFLDNPKYTRHDLETLLNKLLAHQHIHVRKETLWLIGNLCNHESANVSHTIKDVIPLLSSLKQATVSVTQPVIYMT